MSPSFRLDPLLQPITPDQFSSPDRQVGQFGKALHFAVDRIVNVRLRAAEDVGGLLNRQHG